jgi:ABC-type molybdenum transport system ATPase subunit/photorepair protein PhrA
MARRVSGYGPPVSDAVLSLTGVAVVRDRATLLADVDWTIREGERWVVLGPNGAGKTTLMQVASASLFPTRGRVELLGEVFGAVDLSELRTRVGISSAALGDRIPAVPLIGAAEATTRTRRSAPRWPCASTRGTTHGSSSTALQRTVVGTDQHGRL